MAYRKNILLTETEKKVIRTAGIRARDILAPEQREEYSRRIVEALLATPEYRKARTVMVYRAVRGEVSLEDLINDPSAAEKRLVYPRCVDKVTMTALEPVDKSSWTIGSFGIAEPDPGQSVEIDPAEIDLVICPCTAFDQEGNRTGMGAGYYDRFLEKCSRAVIFAVAFEVQKADRIPPGAWDRPMDRVYTEKGSCPAAPPSFKNVIQA